jgi:pimeloyl-ACP methyl ester carboxylesterase
LRLFASAVALSLALPFGAGEPARSAIAFSPCQLAHPVLPLRVPARCGTFAVLENFAQPKGRTIALRVALLPAETPRPQADPVFVLAGGPGQSITETYPALAAAFERLNRDRDVVLVDQRGTGGSGLLSCPDEGRSRLDVRSGDDRRRAAECARSISADLTQYGTAPFVHDLELVRAAMGYERVNLVAFSYGTRGALAYARAHPDRTRTLVLDGVAPFEMVVGATFDRDSERALAILFDRCRADPACRGRYPDLPGEFRALLRRLEQHPEKVRTAHPTTGEPLDLTVDADALRQVVLGFLYQAETAALLPALLREAAGGDLAPIAAEAILVGADIQAGLSRPVHLSVLCTEDVPFYSDTGPTERGRTFLGPVVRDALRDACSAWPRGQVGQEIHEPAEVPVPALLLSGEADPVTPPSWAALAARSLPHSRSITLTGQGHGNFGRGCVPRLAAEFVVRGTAEGLDTACLDRLRPAPIFVDLLGGTP